MQKEEVIGSWNWKFVASYFRNRWIQVLMWFLHEILSSPLGLPCYRLALSSGSRHLQVCLVFIAHSLMEPECLFLCYSSQNPGIRFHWTLLDHVLISGPVTVTEDMKCRSQLSLTEIPAPGTWLGQLSPKHINSQHRNNVSSREMWYWHRRRENGC